MSNEEFEGGEETTEEPEATVRPPKRGPKRPPPVGIAAPPGFKRESDQADDVWNEICAWLPSQGLEPNNIAVSVKRIMPPGPGNQPVAAGGFGGESISPNDSESPGTSLVDYMIRYVHLPMIQTAATYQLQFRHKARGIPITVGNLSLPDRQTCLNMINATEAAQAGNQGHGVGAVPRAPQPRQAWEAPPPPQQYPQVSSPYALPPGFGPPAGYGAPPQSPQAPNMPPEAWQMMQSMMDRAFAERGLAAPQAPPPAGVAAPFNEQAMAERITASVLMALQKVPGIGAPPAAAPPVAAPPPAPTPASGLGAMVEGMTMRLMENIIKASGENMEKSIKQSMGMGAPPATADEPGEDETPAPEKPEDLLPWQAAPTGATWANGSPVVYAKPKPKDDGSDPTLTDYIAGFAMNNPAALEKGMEIAQGVGNAIKEFLSRPTPGTARVVNRIPAAAVDAGVGAGWAPLPPKDSSGGTPPAAPAAPGGWAP